MASPTYPIKYTINDQKFPSGALPVIEVPEDSMAYGSAEIDISILTNITEVTAQLWQVNPPTVDEKRWIRIEPEISTDGVLTWSYKKLKESNWLIEWQLLMSSLSGENLQQYSVEFFVNPGQAVTVSQISPKFIVKIKNRIETIS